LQHPLATGVHVLGLHKIYVHGYCMCMLSWRLQILIDEGRYARLADRAEKRGVSVASVIREAIDRSFPPRDERREDAGRRIIAAEPMTVPDPEELRRELEALRDRSA
jgi:hypothetical protein